MKRFTISVPDKLYEKLLASAEENFRSTTAEICYQLSGAYANCNRSDTCPDASDYCGDNCKED